MMAVVAAAGFAAAPSIFRAVAFKGGWTAASTAGTAASAAFAAALAATGGGTTATADLASVVPAADGAGHATADEDADVIPLPGRSTGLGPPCSISLDFGGERLEEGGRQDIAIVIFVIKDPEDELDVLTLVLVACACDHAVLHDPACLGVRLAERVRTGAATASAVGAVPGFAAAPSIFRAVAFEGGWTAASTAGGNCGHGF